MRRRPSSWWYALPGGIAVVAVVIGGLVVGAQLAGAGKTAFAKLDEIAKIEPSGLRLTMQEDEQRLIAASSDNLGSRPDQASVRCRVGAAEGQLPPSVTPFDASGSSDFRVDVDGRSWYPLYRVTATQAGQLLFECAAGDASTKFVVTPSFDAADFAGYGVAGALALGGAAVGLLVALTLAAVVAVLQMTHSQPTENAQRHPQQYAQQYPQG